MGVDEAPEGDDGDPDPAPEDGAEDMVTENGRRKESGEKREMMGVRERKWATQKG